jgi:hypothetical protein
MGTVLLNLRNNPKRSWQRSSVVGTLVLLLLTAGVAFAGQPANDDARDCVAAALHGFGADCVVADLDADHQPDVALSLDLAGIGGFPGAISIHLSHGQADQHLAVPGNRSNLTLSTRDVDGDGDLDIALTGAINETVGVFLNDGSGQFKLDESGRYTNRPNSDYSHFSVPSENDRVAWPLANSGTPFSLIPARRSETLALSTMRLRQASRDVPCRCEASPIRIRAP